jgi:3-oxoacyl-(acyl-carrier-protein) synthase/thioesterase domain-containing protein/aryl carrier-like protein
MEKKENPETTGLEIAVIGMAGRFPGANNVDEFWKNLKNGVESISTFSDEELAEEGIDTRLPENPNYIKNRGALENIEYFDASFFGFTPTDAALIDPQIRLFLECSWQALEDAGYDPGSYDGFIGLFAGASDNFLWKAETRLAMVDHPDKFFGSLINNKDFMSLLVSYKLNLKGPSFTMYTACSSSLAAIHLACQAILNGECDMALAGGVTVLLPNRTGYLFQPGMLNSRDGHCRAFDARAKGTIFGSGAGLIALKLLEEAIMDNDHIYAVVKGSAINNDGLRKVGFTAPSIEGQEEVIRTAQQAAHVEAESIGYIETHGTATELGDPVEIEALQLAFNTGKKQFCAIGSVKTNVGHLDSAAGVTGFIKTALVLKHRLIPPNLHFETANPAIDFANSPFYVNTELKEWQPVHLDSGPAPARAGVSAFGIGGTNAHVILEEYCRPLPDPETGAGTRRALPPGQGSQPLTPEIFLLSANTPSALDRATENLVAHIKNSPHINLSDIAYTLAVGRKHFKFRRMAVCNSREDVSRIFSTPGTAAPLAVIEKENTGLTEFDTGRDVSALNKTGRLWLQGFRFDWKDFYSQRDVYRVSLPTYPFERQRYWIQERLMKLLTQGGSPGATEPRDTGGQPAGPTSIPEKTAVGSGTAAVDVQPRPQLITPYVAPGNELEQNVCEVWKKLFGFEQIGVNDDFYELGGDSVKAITLTSEFNKIGIEVSINEILSNPAIKKLASAIGEREKSKELEDEIYEQRLLRDLDCLEKLNKGRHERNLFIVHPDTGMLASYKELALLLEKTFNVYGIKARGLEPGTDMPATPGQMIDDYTAQILTFQEDGPYRIAGFGIGNLLAYEIAKRLEQQSRQVEKIVLLDPYIYITDRAFKLRRAATPLPAFIRKAVLFLNERKFKKEIRTGNLLIGEKDDETSRKDKVIKYLNSTAKYAISFGIIKAPLLVLQAKESPYPGTARLRFDRMTGGSVSLVKVPGTHDSLLEKPGVETLADVLIHNI